MFSKTSRYHGLPERTYRAPDGREVVYVGRRLVPLDGGPIAAHRTVGQSDRLDLIAARELGRPELYWRLCDANRALDPVELVEPTGQSLLVPEI